MSVRIEWTQADAAGVAVLERGDEAGDGGLVTKDACLVIGTLAVEGTIDEIMFLLANAAAALISPIEDAEEDVIYARATRNMLVGCLNTHERLRHGGDVCPVHRTDVFAFLAHSAGLRPEHLAPVAVELVDYNTRHDHIHGNGNGNHPQEK